MTSPSTRVRFAVRFALVAATALGCSAATSPTGDGSTDSFGASDAVSDVQGCRLTNGSVCSVGMSCPAGDGCNTCTCGPSGGVAACTERACPPPMDAGSRACSTAADCARNESCVFPLSACSSRGTCEPELRCLVPRSFCACSGVVYQACVPDRPTVSEGTSCVPPVRDGGTRPCGATTCGANQLCEYACCGGAAPPCEPRTDAGTCPAGSAPGPCFGPGGPAFDCTRMCTPPPPHCVDLPAACGGRPDCACLRGASVCGGVGCGFVDPSGVHCVCA